MRILVAVMMLAILCMSCSRERSPIGSQQNSKETVSPAAQSPKLSNENRHVYLSSVDLAKELNEHCGKASAAMNRAAELVSARTPDLKELSSRLDEAKRSMSSCMTMVHGVEENVLGAEAEENGERK